MAGSEQPIDNPFGLAKFLEAADGVSYAILIIMTVTSLVSWFIILVKYWDQTRIGKSYAEARKKFWAAGNLHDGMAALTGRDNVFRMLAEDGVRAAQYHAGHLTEQVSLNDWIALSLHRSAESVNNRLATGLAILATAGSVSPFVGLLGTVWGIYNALMKISFSGAPNVAEISGPIGEALIMTAIGLFVAVPAVVGYNWLLRRNRSINEKMKHFAGEVHTFLIGGARMDTSAPLLRTVGVRGNAIARPA